MSEIEKMMQNANIEPIAEYCKHQCNNEFDDDACIGCKHIEKVEYPTFTAEKQIAILKFCLKWGQVHILQGIDNEYRIENSCYRQGYQPTLADAIANYINEKWEKLTPEEKQQVKGILE